MGKRKRTADNNHPTPAVQPPDWPVEPIDTPPDGDLAEAAAILSEIEAVGESRLAIRQRMDDAKQSYKALKEEYLELGVELDRLSRARKERHPLFEQGTLEPGDGQPDDPLAAVAGKHVSSVGLTAAQCERLEGAGLNTVGDLQRAISKHSLNWGREYGLTENMRLSIQEALNEYLLQITQAADIGRMAAEAATEEGGEAE